MESLIVLALGLKPSH